MLGNNIDLYKLPFPLLLNSPETGKTEFGHWPSNLYFFNAYLIMSFYTVLLLLPWLPVGLSIKTKLLEGPAWPDPFQTTFFILTISAPITTALSPGCLKSHPLSTKPQPLQMQSSLSALQYSFFYGFLFCFIFLHSKVLLCIPAWLQNTSPPASISQLLRSQMCATMLGFTLVLLTPSVHLIIFLQLSIQSSQLKGYPPMLSSLPL